MKAGNNNSSKLISRVSYSKNGTSKDGTSNNRNRWHLNHKENSRDDCKNHKTDRDQWNHKSFQGERESSCKRNQEIFSEIQQTQIIPDPTTSYLSYYRTNDQSFKENNHHTLSMMSNYMRTTTAMNNTQWQINTMEGITRAQNNTPSISAMPTTMEIFQASGFGINPCNYMGMTGELSLIGMNNYGIVGQLGMGSDQENMLIPQVKEVINFSKGVLLPPNPNTPSLPTQDKPMGCKTIFVSGLPDRISEEIIQEIFEKAGEIERIRMGKRRFFCHVRFKEAASVERALYYSGYRMNIDNNDGLSFTGKIHVDYAIDRDDQHEYKCQQRMIQRLARHQELENFRVVTPPIIHFTSHEIASIVEKLRNEETFMQGSCVLINWLYKGECTKQNAGTFYSMIQSINSHVRRIITEKVKYEEQLTNSKEKLKKYVEGIIYQFNEIEKVFNAACLQKVWDHFTKAQRKNIKVWKKQAEEIKNAHVEEIINGREDESMDLSDDEISDYTEQMSANLMKNQLEEENSKLRDENESLRYQLEIARKEINELQAEAEEQLNAQEINDKILNFYAMYSSSMMKETPSTEVLNNEYSSLKKCIKTSSAIRGNHTPRKAMFDSMYRLAPAVTSLPVYRKRKRKSPPPRYFGNLVSIHCSTTEDTEISEMNK